MSTPSDAVGPRFKGAPTPDDLFEAARTNQFLHKALVAWRQGDCTFERALVAACCYLAAENESQREQLAEERPSP